MMEKELEHFVSELTPEELVFLLYLRRDKNRDFSEYSLQHLLLATS